MEEQSLTAERQIRHAKKRSASWVSSCKKKRFRASLNLPQQQQQKQQQQQQHSIAAGDVLEGSARLSSLSLCQLLARSSGKLLNNKNNNNNNNNKNNNNNNSKNNNKNNNNSKNNNSKNNNKNNNKNKNKSNNNQQQQQQQSQSKQQKWLWNANWCESLLNHYGIIVKSLLNHY